MAREVSSDVKEGQLLGKVSSVVELLPGSDEGELRVDEVSFDKIILSELNERQRSMVLNTLNKVKGVFSVDEFDLGHANVSEHVIKLSSETPIYQRPRRFSPPVAEENNSVESSIPWM